jgi:hypothetical protein
MASPCGEPGYCGIAGSCCSFFHSCSSCVRLVSTLSDHWVVALPDDTCFSTVFTVVDIIFLSDWLITHSMHNANTVSAFWWAIWGLSVGTNFWATSFMFIRAWYVAFDTIVTCYVLHDDATSFKGNTDASCVLFLIRKTL